MASNEQWNEDLGTGLDGVFLLISEGIAWGLEMKPSFGEIAHLLRTRYPSYIRQIEEKRKSPLTPGSMCSSSKSSVMAPIGVSLSTRYMIFLCMKYVRIHNTLTSDIRESLPTIWKLRTHGAFPQTTKSIPQVRSLPRRWQRETKVLVPVQLQSVGQATLPPSTMA